MDISSFSSYSRPNMGPCLGDGATVMLLSWERHDQECFVGITDTQPSLEEGGPAVPAASCPPSRPVQCALAHYLFYLLPALITTPVLFCLLPERRLSPPPWSIPRSSPVWALGRYSPRMLTKKHIGLGRGGVLQSVLASSPAGGGRPAQSPAQDGHGLALVAAAQ